MALVVGRVELIRQGGLRGDIAVRQIHVEKVKEDEAEWGYAVASILMEEARQGR
jgi:hypothetical protein